MPLSELPIALLAGVIAGLAASAAMEAYQALAAPLFGQATGNDDPSTVQAADSVSQTVAGGPVAQTNRRRSGRSVHYATGLALGVSYALVAAHWLPITIGFGVAFGLVVAVLLDDVVVPVFGWGPPPWKTPLSTHVYGLSAHVVFGAVLEGARRLVVGLL